LEAFADNGIKAVVATIGGDDQITYVKNLKIEDFEKLTKPFFGFSDNTHFCNFLWLNGVPSFYGASIFTQFAMQGDMDEFTVEYIRHAFFDHGEFELKASPVYNDEGLSWDDESTLTQRRKYEKNDGWNWDGEIGATGITWGGCLESIDEILRHGTPMPTLEQFENIVLFTETSEEIPSADYVRRVYRALGERGILAKVKAILVGRPKAWEFHIKNSPEQKQRYRDEQMQAILEVVRQYNPSIPVVQNMDFGHTDPQICLPYGGKVRLDSQSKKIYAEF